VAARPGPAPPPPPVQAAIARLGSIRFDEALELALYDPEHGFYGSGGGAGRGRDFLTSPEVGPLFGAVVARALDRWWDEAGRPDPWVVVDAGAGPGTLARTVLAAEPACQGALRYVMVERSAELRRSQRDHLDVEEPAWALGPAVPESGDVGGDERLLEPGAGPVVTALAELPALRFQGVVLANELLDNLAFRLLERTADGWSEVRVALADDGRAVELVVPADEAAAARASRFAPDAPVGARIPLQDAAAAWVRTVLERLEAGRLVVLDYASTSPRLAERPVGEWLRTYRGHERGVPPLEGLGTQDVTTELAVDQLAAVRSPTLDRTQAEALVDWGIEALVEEGKAIWAERAHLGDLEAVKARSRVTEAEALLDPAGLGAFRALEWAV